MKVQDAVVVAFEPAVMKKATELLIQLAALGCSVHATEGFELKTIAAAVLSAGESVPPAKSKRDSRKIDKFDKRHGEAVTKT